MFGYSSLPIQLIAPQSWLLGNRNGLFLHQVNHALACRSYSTCLCFQQEVMCH